MRIYGYSRKEVGKGLLEMREVTVSANPVVLKAMANFLRTCAEAMEKDPMRWDHEHFAPPTGTSGQHTPSFIVTNPRK